MRSSDTYPRADGLSEGRQLREWKGLGKVRAGGEILLPFMFGTRGKTNSPSLPIMSTGKFTESRKTLKDFKMFV